MSERLGRLMALLDNATQRTEEAELAPEVTALPDGRCWRCARRDAAAGATVCGPCRAFLLGDGPDPDAPTNVMPAWAQRTLADYLVAVTGLPSERMTISGYYSAQVESAEMTDLAFRLPEGNFFSEALRLRAERQRASHTDSE